MRLLTGVVVAVLALAVHTAARADTVKLVVPTLPVPSLGYFMPPVIKGKGFDRANGLDITFVQKPASTYRTDFAAGTDLIGGSGTILADVALLNQKGVETVYLFNVFEFWAAVVVPRDSSVKTLADLKGKVLAAALPTTSFAMFRYFANRAGLDLSTVQLRGTTVPGLVPMARSGRAEAVQLWEPAYSILTYGNSDFRTIDFVGAWKEVTGLSAIPYLGVAAHRSWVEEHRDLVPKLYRTYRLAAEFVRKHPAEAAEMIGRETDIDPKIVEELISSGRLGLDVYWAAENREAAGKVFAAAMEVGYLKESPPADVLYEPAK